ncbi:hypothetical protein NLU13_2077 [Sarocladium strictum]|uniref:Transmembrane protein n=1 Tax=Sarocladium strictum TaxID=5046 RepID=A0AA39LCW4_SARSR|nr:hypothetical protein NLU13_2077 [Sarocladium strictum]
MIPLRFSSSKMLVIFLVLLILALGFALTQLLAMQACRSSTVECLHDMLSIVPSWVSAGHALFKENVFGSSTVECLHDMLSTVPSWVSTGHALFKENVFGSSTVECLHDMLSTVPSWVSTGHALFKENVFGSSAVEEIHTQSVDISLDEAFPWTIRNVVSQFATFFKDHTPAFLNSSVAELAPVYHNWTTFLSSSVDELAPVYHNWTASLAQTCSNVLVNLRQLPLLDGTAFATTSATVSSSLHWLSPATASAGSNETTTGLFSSAMASSQNDTQVMAPVNEIVEAAFENDAPWNIASQVLQGSIAALLLVIIFAHPNPNRFFKTLIYFVISPFLPLWTVKQSMLEMRNHMWILDIGDLLETRDKYGAHLLYRVYRSPESSFIRTISHGIVDMLLPVSCPDSNSAPPGEGADADAGPGLGHYVRFRCQAA